MKRKHNWPLIFPENMAPNFGVELCGMRVNCRGIARHIGHSWPHVINVINGKRTAMIGVYIKIAGCIGVTIDELLAGIEQRKKMQQELAEAALKSYQERIAKENEEARAAVKAGRPVVPQMSAFRLPKDRVVIPPRKYRTRG